MAASRAVDLAFDADACGTEVIAPRLYVRSGDSERDVELTPTVMGWNAASGCFGGPSAPTYGKQEKHVFFRDSQRMKAAFFAHDLRKAKDILVEAGRPLEICNVEGRFDDAADARRHLFICSASGGLSSGL